MLNSKQLYYYLRRGAIVRLQVGHEISVYLDDKLIGRISLEMWHELRKLEKLEFYRLTENYMDYRLAVVLPDERVLSGEHFKYVERDAHNVYVKHFESGKYIKLPYGIWIDDSYLLEDVLKYE